jgi:predicted  nucleic acid-binding Zn-ribbon protein
LLEDELASLAEKAAGVDRQLYGGTVTNLRELQGLQDEVAALDRRRRALEDQVLEHMVESEPLDAALEAFATQRAALDEQAVAATAALIDVETAIDGELAVVEGQRAQAAARIPTDLLERYEKLRRGHDGVGVARLDGNRCLGCHLALPAAEVEAVKRAPADEPVECPECSRLLVR